ncbi:DUF2142 domain-containing protein [Schaalia turicensis]|uniref:DUF2142 domain-containing protein n=1 Tax=Schaalia turicensis TaxID=131111 RepID=UPI0036D0EE26
MLTSHDNFNPRRFYVVAGLLTVLFICWQLLWAIVTPPFRAPDEPHHYNSIIRVEQQGTWPDPGEAYLYEDVFDAAVGSGLLAPQSPDFSLPYRTILGRDAWIGTDSASFRSQKLLPHDQRTSPQAEGTVTVRDQMTQHPPLYYAGGALMLRATGMTDVPWDRQILVLRIYSILLTAPLVPCIIFAVRRTGLSRRGALLASGVVYAVPMIAFNSASVTNDALFIGAGALTMAAVSAAMFGSGRWRTVIAAGLALGLGLWSKGTFIPMGLVVFLSFLTNPRIGTWRRRCIQGLAAGSLSLLVGGYWWVRNMIRYGVIQPDGFRTPGGEPGTDYFYFMDRVATSFVESFWSGFGWLEVKYSEFFLLILLLLSIGLVIRALITHPGKRLRLLMYTANTVFVLGMLLVQVFNQYRGIGVVSGVQGRYLFAGAVGLILVFAIGAAGRSWDNFSTTPGEGADVIEDPTWRTAVLPALVAGSLLLGAYAMVLWVRSCYPGAFFGMDPLHWSLAIGISTTWLKLMAVGGIGSLLLAGVFHFRLAWELLRPVRPADGAARRESIPTPAGITKVPAAAASVQ